MVFRPSRSPSAWLWLLALFTAASFMEAVSTSHVTAFMPLYLPQLGVPGGAILAGPVTQTEVGTAVAHLAIT